ncbi:MAG: chlorophyll synthesis pathway protein BchC [Caulobacteraceae bacterium]|nr:chlorophyll synthesis pathway protein BchC [Caulobacteraceae bacterium]
MHTTAIVLEEPKRLSIRRVDLVTPADDDVVVQVEVSGISTGTERLLWDGRMPAFPGMGYPLVPGYEAVGRVVDAGRLATARVGERVFAPGSSNFIDARGLFGGAARTLVTRADRVSRLPEGASVQEAALLSLAATAHHALSGGRSPDLVVGAGVLGRLIARTAVALGHPAPTLWETNPARMGEGAIHPDADPRRDHAAIYDCSGDGDLLDVLVGRLARGGEIVLAGFYEHRLSFAFPPAFMKEARLRIAAEFTPADVAAMTALIEAGRLSLAGLITHARPVAEAEDAYAQAFEDPSCLKMILDWRDCP